MLTEALAVNAARGAYPPSDPPQTRFSDHISYVTYRRGSKSDPFLRPDVPTGNAWCCTT